MKQRIIQALPARLFVALKKWGWYGNFPDWENAKKHTKGYDDGVILDKVKNALLKVKNGQAIYERDSVIFDKIEYSWEVLSGLMWIAAQNKGALNLIDFGGSLGSTYFQNKRFLDSLDSASWNIIEQSNFVEEGIKSFEDNTLKFFYSVEECIAKNENKINCILFACVLQYLEHPFELLKDVFRHKIQYIVVDRVCFTKNGKQRLTIQKVPAKIYNASYPCWFFSEKEFMTLFEENGYECVADFPGSDQINIPSEFKGFIFKLKS